MSSLSQLYISNVLSSDNILTANKILVPGFHFNCTFTYHRALISILHTNDILKIISHLPDIMKLCSEKYKCNKEEHWLPSTALVYWLSTGSLTLHSVAPQYSNYSFNYTKYRTCYIFLLLYCKHWINHYNIYLILYFIY